MVLLLGWFFGAGPADAPAQHHSQRGSAGGVLAILVVAVWAPVVEELLFRGFLSEQLIAVSGDAWLGVVDQPHIVWSW